MSNMGYCRFENTLPDLRDCYENMDDRDLNETEKRCRGGIIKLAKDIVEDYAWEIEE